MFDSIKRKIAVTFMNSMYGSHVHIKNSDLLHRRVRAKIIDAMLSATCIEHMEGAERMIALFKMSYPTETDQIAMLTDMHRRICLKIQGLNIKNIKEKPKENVTNIARYKRKKNK